MRVRESLTPGAVMILLRNMPTCRMAVIRCTTGHFLSPVPVKARTSTKMYGETPPRGVGAKLKKMAQRFYFLHHFNKKLYECLPKRYTPWLPQKPTPRGGGETYRILSEAYF